MNKDHRVSNPTFSSVLIIQEAPKQRLTSSTSRTRASSSSCSIYMALRFTVHFIIPLVLSCFVAPADSSCNQIDKDSLLAFSRSLTIASPYPPLNWTASVDCCSWEGIFCAEDKDNRDKRVINVSLPSRGLGGSISPYLSNLTGLLWLNLSHNRFSGNLPTHFFSLLNHLQILDLSYNWLSGELPNIVDNNNSRTIAINGVDLSSNIFHGVIPSSFLQQLGVAAARRSLTYFNVSNNSFTGQIPISLFCINKHNSSSLGHLDFSFNKYSGQIPYGIRACSKLEGFRAGFNSLTGPLPSDIYDAISLTEISLPFNKISGNISDSITSLTNLTTLELFFNQLIGQIPQTIGKLSKLEHLLLHNNNLIGMFPLSLRNCINLVTLILRINFLEGNLSNFNFSGFGKLTTLDLFDNKFTGKLPTTLFSCKSLVAVRFAGNQLEGEISPDILALQSLSFLSISTNKLRNFAGAMRILARLQNLTLLLLSQSFNEEVMPNDENLVGPNDFQNLQVLSLRGCNFTGSIPRWLVNFQKLQVLDLSNNQLNGSIPTWLGTLSQLFYLQLSHNFITGIFPLELARLPALSTQHKIELHLVLPVFFVPIYDSQQQYNGLSYLPPAIYLRNNRLSGNILIEISQLKAIHQLDLSHNYFSGNIPVQLSNLTNLEKLDLSRNHLSGEIPISLKNLNFLSFFSVADNDLQGEIPTGGQFDTFPPSSFEGNPRLCGTLIVNRSFPSQQKQRGRLSLAYPSSKRALHIGLGFIIGFSVFFNLTVYTLWFCLDRLLKKYFSHLIIFM